MEGPKNDRSGICTTMLQVNPAIRLSFVRTSGSNEVTQLPAHGVGTVETALKSSAGEMTRWAAVASRQWFGIGSAQLGRNGVISFAG